MPKADSGFFSNATTVGYLSLCVSGMGIGVPPGTKSVPRSQHVACANSRRPKDNGRSDAMHACDNAAGQGQRHRAHELECLIPRQVCQKGSWNLSPSAREDLKRVAAQTGSNYPSSGFRVQSMERKFEIGAGAVRCLPLPRVVLLLPPAPHELLASLILEPSSPDVCDIRQTDSSAAFELHSVCQLALYPANCCRTKAGLPALPA